jgi:hypothetical protein
MLGADEAPEFMPVLSDVGYSVLLANNTDYPQLDIFVRVHDFSQDTIIDPTRILEGPLNQPRFSLGTIHPHHILGRPFFEIDLRQHARARINFFIHTRNAQSTVELVALRTNGGNKIAFRQRFSEANAKVEIPADFPIIDRGNPESLFAEDEPTGRFLVRAPEGLRPA